MTGPLVDPSDDASGERLAAARVAGEVLGEALAAAVRSGYASALARSLAALDPGPWLLHPDGTVEGGAFWLAALDAGMYVRANPDNPGDVLAFLPAAPR